MFRLTCRYIQSRIPAFVDGELSVETRRFIGRHLDQCQDCKTRYMQQRDAIRHIEREMPTFVRPEQTMLNDVWSRIENDLQTVTPSPEALAQPVAMRPKMRYGFAAAVFLLALMLPPVLLSSADGQTIVPSQPAPILTETPARTATSIGRPTSIAQVIQTEAVDRYETPALLGNTPVTTPAPTR